MTNPASVPVSGLDLILEFLEQTYQSDGAGRLTAIRSGGVPPRFIFARSAEGCLWRFRSDLSKALVVETAKLAGRERSGSEWEGEAPPPPERLVMMARMLGEADSPAVAERMVIRREGRVEAEIWSFGDSERDDHRSNASAVD